jgi:ABC-type Fe3+ transport system permease subunit
MDTAAIIVKIVGLVLFAFTVRSVHRHFKRKMARCASRPKTEGKPEQSKIEHALNTFLLYAWFLFMTAFSLGMIVNN